MVVEGFFYWYCADFYAGMTGQGNKSIISRRLRVQAVLPGRLRPRLLIIYLCCCFILSTSFPYSSPMNVYLPAIFTEKIIDIRVSQRRRSRQAYRDDLTHAGYGLATVALLNCYQ